MTRTLYITQPCKISITNHQLCVSGKDKELTAPVEDLARVILEHPVCTITQVALQRLGEHNVAVIVCDESYMPAYMMATLTGNQLQQERVNEQLTISQPLRKQLWQQIIKAKIRNQAGVLKSFGCDDQPLRHVMTKVRSNDSQNKEAHASRMYWPFLLGEDFRRRREGLPPNQLLNFGYAILRSAVARALAAAGLLPLIGIKHHNRYNHFCLADDVMEAYRPFVDRIVVDLFTEHDQPEDIPKEIKQELIGMLDSDVIFAKESHLMRNAIEKTCHSLRESFAGKKARIQYPNMYDNL